MRSRRSLQYWEAGLIPFTWPDVQNPMDFAGDLRARSVLFESFPEEEVALAQRKENRADGSSAVH